MVKLTNKNRSIKVKKNHCINELTACVQQQISFIINDFSERDCMCMYINVHMCGFVFVSIAVVTKHRAKLCIIFIKRKEIISKYLFYFRTRTDVYGSVRCADFLSHIPI